MSGTTIAQAIPIAISPILTRIYTPEDFGIFALYMSIASIVSVIATGRYELAIMLPKKDDDAINIVALSILISFCVSLLSLIIVFVFNAQITNLLGNPEIANWLYFIPITVLFTGIYQSFNYWSNRKKQYKRLATSKVLQSGTTATTNIGMGFGGLGSSGLIFGSVLGQGIATAILAKIIWKEDKNRLDTIKRLKIVVLIGRYIKLPLYNLPNALIDGIRMSGIDILITRFFSSAILGQFYLAFRMLQAPMSLIGSSISQVFIQKISSVSHSEIAGIIRKFLMKASIIALPIFVFIYFFAADIFIFVFGMQWRMAGKIASILTPWVFLNFLSSPISNVFIVLHKQEIMLIFSIFYMAIPLCLLYFFHQFGLEYALNLIAFFMSIMLVIFIIMAHYFAKKEKE